MKKFLVLTGLVIAALFVLALFNPAAPPSLSASRPRMAVRENAVYLAENRPQGSFIYRVTPEGMTELVKNGPVPERGKHSAIMDLVFLRDELFYIRAIGNQGENVFTQWELITLGENDQRMRTVFTHAGPAPELSAGENTLYLSFISDGEVSVFQLNPYAENIMMNYVRMAEAPEGIRILSAAYDGAKLYCALSDGRMAYYTVMDTRPQAVFMQGDPAGLSVSGGNVFFADNAGGTVYADMGGGLTRLALPEGFYVRAGAAVKGYGFIMFSQDGILRRYDGEQYSGPIQPHSSPSQNLLFAPQFLRHPQGWIVLAAAVSVLLLGLCFIPQRFFIRFSAMQSVFSILLSAGIIWLVMDRAAGTGVQTDALLRDLILACGYAVGAVTLLTLLFTWRFARPLRILIRQMGEIGAGRFDVEAVRAAKGEIGAVQRAVQEMCVSLSIENYKNRVTLDSYHRFIPQGIARLLGRGNITEVESGDAEALEGVVAIVAAGNRDKVRARTDDEKFMDFVGRCFEDIYTAAKEQDAVFLSDDFNLSGLRLAFPGGIDSALKFCFDLTGQNEDNAPSFTALLHSARYLLGITGTGSRAFTFLSSAELDYLDKIAPELARLGVKLVMTEVYKNQIGEETDTRYIGFISSPDGRHTFKLYEALNAYPSEERRKRLKYDHEFQEALRLYYKNDFYLARNLFSNIYKASPGDDMARWYLFACEQSFQEEDAAGVNYSIFGDIG
jgi:hypothetical protein